MGVLESVGSVTGYLSKLDSRFAAIMEGAGVSFVVSLYVVSLLYSVIALTLPYNTCRVRYVRGVRSNINFIKFVKIVLYRTWWTYRTRHVFELSTLGPLSILSYAVD